MPYESLTSPWGLGVTPARSPGVEADGEEIVIRRPSETLLDREWPGDLRLPLAELCVWVDPLDGTKEFTQGAKGNPYEMGLV